MTEPTLVWLQGQLAGALTTTRRGGATFQYTAEMVDLHRGRPLLSTTLPVQPEAFDADRTRIWFTGLLPEDRQLDEVRRRFNLQIGSYVDVLREIGWECAGAVVMSPTDAVPPPGDYRPLSSNELAGRLKALPSHPYDDNEALRVSLGGFQAKLLVCRTGSGWALPLGGAVSTHILKPQSATAFPGLIAAEAWGMAVAAQVTPTASIELLRFENGPLTLAVERFDRDCAGLSMTRLHQEDAGQAMGIPTEHKYASSGSPSRSDPTLARLASLLDHYAVTPRLELRRLVEQLTVNVALGNTDAHAKNYGLLHPSAASVSLSPMYDVVPATVVNPGQLEMGLRVDQTLRLDRVTGAKLIAEAGSWGIGPRVAQSYVETTLVRLRDAVAGVEPADGDSRVQLAVDCAARVERLLTSL